MLERLYSIFWSRGNSDRQRFPPNDSDDITPVHEDSAKEDSAEEQLTEGSIEEESSPSTRRSSSSPNEAAEAANLASKCINFRKPKNSPSILGNPVEKIFSLKEEIAKFEIKICNNDECIKAKSRLRNVAPACELEFFREWALTVVSCWSYQKSLFLNSYDSTYLPVEAAGWCQSLLDDLGRKSWVGPDVRSQFGKLLVVTDRDFALKRSMREKNRPSFLFGLLLLLEWVSTISPLPASPDSIDRAWGGDFGSLSIPEVQKTAQVDGVCLHRLWNVVMATRSGVVTMPSIVSLLNDMILSRDHVESHQHCTAQTCLKNDENTTVVPQLHTCNADKENCSDVELFPVDELNAVTDPGLQTTAWTVKKPHNFECSKYLAISHVWSNGTGVGLQSPGTVNKCLFKRFADIATSLDCDGIWWDSISVPTKKDKRRLALNTMNKNYSRAEHTLVHDLELVNFTWKDDGSPCLALALSTWFSRGWTALELMASKSVKVLFRDSDGQLVLKDLDKDILASPRDPFAHPAHRAVSRVIQRLRAMQLDLLMTLHDSATQDILDIMRPRHTCWGRDRMIITALALTYKGHTIHGFDSSLPQVQITQAILKSLRQVDAWHLFHGQVTISDTGPWSWCPPSFFDLKDTKSSSSTSSQLTVMASGGLSGIMQLRELDENDKDLLMPYGSHPSLILRINAAFQDWKNHCLMYPVHAAPQQMVGQEWYLLVKDLGTKGENTPEYLKRFHVQRWANEYRYVGTVVGHGNVSKALRFSKAEIILV
ncbi:hypothetical protein TCE0_013f00842 [Talaromyces pinophilus]|uniref:Heterokaryon incompatibility domain-containing protein n=1 Tax=Talaromyces pinophilus TaxID=128442 RepID=A0A698XL59_TALPI|nr:hypothetical protein TCE0_013f00842 [Talaromyces pinophilus]